MYVGQRSAIVSRRLREKFHEAICYQPSVVFLDNLDSIAPFIADIQQDASGEGPMSSKRCQSTYLVCLFVCLY